MSWIEPKSPRLSSFCPHVLLFPRRLLARVTLGATCGRYPFVWCFGNTRPAPGAGGGGLNRHCERSEAIHFCRAKEEWIASSRNLSSGAHSRDPLAPRNDVGHKCTFSRRDTPELCKDLPPSHSEGAGNAGRAWCARSRACSGSKHAR